MARPRRQGLHRLRTYVSLPSLSFQFSLQQITGIRARSETTVGVISNQSTAPSPPPPFSLPIGRPTGTTRIYILPSQDPTDLRPLPLGCIGEICVLGPQVTRGYVRTELNKGVFLELDGSEAIGKVGERLYRTGDLGRWVAAPWEEEGEQERWIECLGRKDGQVKVNGLRYVSLVALLVETRSN